MSLDRLAMAPPEELARYGVTPDNADVLHPGRKLRARSRRTAAALRAERVMRAAQSFGATADEIADALITAGRRLKGLG